METSKVKTKLSPEDLDKLVKLVYKSSYDRLNSKRKKDILIMSSKLKQKLEEAYPEIKERFTIVANEWCEEDKVYYLKNTALINPFDYLA